MTLKTRRFLFFLLSFLFLIVGASLILYSAGIIFDFKTFRFVSTGGIYLESDPPDVQITLNDRVMKRDAGLLQAGTFISNLTPGHYKISLSRDGYQTWLKETEVLPQGVSVFNKIMLFPLKTAEKLSGPLEDFHIDNDRLIVRNGNNLSYDGRRIAGNRVVNLAESGAVVTRDERSGNYYFSTLQDLNSSLNISLIFNNLRDSRLGLKPAQITRLVPYQYNDRKFIVKTDGTIYSLDIERFTLELLSTNVKDFAVGESKLFWLNTENFLLTYNLPLRNEENARISIPISSPIKKFSVSPDENRLLIIEENNNSLILIDKEKLEATQIASKIKDAAFSNNSKFIIFANEAGEVTFFRPEMEKIVAMKPVPNTSFSALSWYRDDAHLLAQNSEGNLLFIEVDDRKPQNVGVIGTKVVKYIYDQSTNQVYFENTGGLWRFEL